MKIENGMGIEKAGPGGLSKTKNGSAPDREFDKIFKQQVAKEHLATGTGQVAGISSAGAVDFARHRVKPPAGIVLDRIESVLDQLEQYCQCLEDPGNSLKQAASVLEQVATRADDLGELSEELEVDSQLDSLVQETMATVFMAKIRFQRGDYC